MCTATLDRRIRGKRCEGAGIRGVGVRFLLAEFPCRRMEGGGAASGHKKARLGACSNVDDRAWNKGARRARAATNACADAARCV